MCKEFPKYLEDAVGEHIASSVMEALAGPASVSVRMNPFKPGTADGAGDRHFPDVTGPVRWSGYGLFLGSRPNFTLDPYFHAGAYYVQDSSAMFVGELFRKAFERVLRDRAGRPVRVLDLCAAPGGKTTDIAASLRPLCGDDFLLVANEVMQSRVGVLADNVASWGDPNVVVTSSDPSAFAALSGYFDMIVADVPCSGEGMFRKDPEAVRQWSEDNVRLCQARQRRIVADVWPALAENGVLVYSTCTFNRYENDCNVQWICGDLGAERMPFPELESLYGCKSGEQGGIFGTESGFLLLPGMVPGEGQYCAAVRKTGKTAVRPARRPGTAGCVKGPDSWFRVPVRFRQAGTRLAALPVAVADEIAVISDAVRVVRAGCTACEVKGGAMVPSADFAFCIVSDGNAFPSAEVDLKQALSFLHKDSLVLADSPRGFLKINYDGLPLGFVKNLGTRCNNLYPQGRRIRMDID